MEWVLYAFSVLWIALGVCLILYTDACRTASRNVLKDAYEKPLFFLALIIGVLLIFSASHSRNAAFIVILGIIAIAKAVLFLFNPRGLYTKMKQWFLETVSDTTYRFFGIVSLVLGVAVFSWI